MNAAVKDTLLECLNGTLSPDGSVRKSCEERLKALEVTENYGIMLLEIVLAENFPPPIRQLASVLLRRYVDEHWTSYSEKFVLPEVLPQVKATLREMAPMGLRESQSKIRNSVAAIISAIAHWDWPESWPNLFEILLGMLRDETSVKGAMRVMAEFSKEFSDQHMIQVAPIILPEMCRMVIEKDVYSVETRARAVQIFRTCAYMIVTMSEMDKNVSKTLLDPVMPSFMEAFVGILLDTGESSGDYTLKKDVIKCISLLLRHCPKKMSNYLPHLLNPAWSILTSSTAKFREIFNGDENDPEIDSDGEKCGIEAVMFSIFELVQNLIDAPSSVSKKIVKDGLGDLIYYTIFYMQLPQERVESWSSDPAVFANDEDEDGMSYTLRICAQDLLINAYEAYPENSIKALGQAVNRHLIEVGAHDWRLQEACLFAVSSLGNRVAKTSLKNPAPGEVFDIHGFVQNVVIPGLSSADILLVGRCLVLGSNFCNVIDPRLTENFIKASVECLQSDKSVILKILAVKALTNFIEQSDENQMIKQWLLEVLPNGIDPLLALGATQSVEVLSTVLRPVIGMLELDERFTASLGQKITTLAIACFVKFNGDPVICPLIEDIVRALCKNTECVVTLQERLTPTIVSILNNEEDSMGGPQGESLDLLTAIVRASPLPLNDMLIQNAFPAVINRFNKSEDHTVLQNSGECLRAFVSVAPAQIVAYRDMSGVSGLSHVVQVACRLMDPHTSEFSASFVGKLVTTLIVKTGDQLGEQLDHLLRAVLSKLQAADTLSVIQNLCMVYAHLFNAQMEAALNFLDSVPGPTGQSALNFVMTEWVSRQHLFYGAFDRKVSSVALSKLLLHGVNNQDPRLATIKVKGDEIIDEKEKSRISTRSQKKVEKWTTIPLLVKIFKLLVNELACCALDTTAEDFEDEDSNTESEGDERNGVNGFNMIGDELFFDDESGLNIDDQDVISNPLYSLDLEAYLKEFIQGFGSQVYFPEFAAHLNKEEIKVLAKNGINTPHVPGASAV